MMFYICCHGTDPVNIRLPNDEMFLQPSNFIHMYTTYNNKPHTTRIEIITMIEFVQRNVQLSPSTVHEKYFDI